MLRNLGGGVRPDLEVSIICTVITTVFCQMYCHINSLLSCSLSYLLSTVMFTVISTLYCHIYCLLCTKCSPGGHGPVDLHEAADAVHGEVGGRVGAGPEAAAHLANTKLHFASIISVSNNNLCVPFKCINLTYIKQHCMILCTISTKHKLPIIEAVVSARLRGRL